MSVFASLAYITSADINVCDDAKTGIFLQDFSDPTCKNYIVCMDGVSYAGGNCKGDYLFNATTQSCSYESEVTCSYCPTKAGVPVYNRAYPSLCSKYVLCYGSTPVVRECAPGLQFDPVQERCNEASLVDCVANKCDAVDNPSDITYVASANNCSK